MLQGVYPCVEESISVCHREYIRVSHRAYHYKKRSILGGEKLEKNDEVREKNALNPEK